MIINDATLEKVCGVTSKLTQTNCPEIIFLGKSNVGKSSFINYLTNRKNLARSSSAPGKTRTINYYRINNEFYFVDLPGYGYAKTSKKEQEKWGEKINEYLYSSETIALAILLIDIRHKPGQNDQMMYEWLKSNDIPTAVVCNKSDKLKRSQLSRNIKVIKDTLNVDDSDIIIESSTLDKNNRDKILDLILGFIYE